MSWSFRTTAITIERKLEPPEPKRWEGKRKISFKEVMLQCYRIREEPERKRQAEAELLLGQELRYIQDHAFHDEGNNSNHPSPGEQDSVMDSVIKNENGEPIVIAGEVLRDPKLRFLAPCLKRR